MRVCLSYSCQYGYNHLPHSTFSTNAIIQKTKAIPLLSNSSMIVIMLQVLRPNRSSLQTKITSPLSFRLGIKEYLNVRFYKCLYELCHKSDTSQGFTKKNNQKTKYSIKCKKETTYYSRSVILNTNQPIK